MAASETLLTVIAIRLAALVVAGLIVKTAVADQPRPAIACVSTTTAAEVHAPPVTKPDETLRDMLLHD